MPELKLALRLLYRDGRSGELTILVLALIIAVTSSTAIALFTDRLQQTMGRQAADFLAADLVISSSSPIPKNWHKKAKTLQLKQSSTTEFSSVLMENQSLLLAGIKAVTALYPLRGQLKITASDLANPEQTNQGPTSSEAWIEPRILSALKLQIGDILTIGEQPLKVTRLITYEPDKGGDLYSLQPRVMINHADLESTHVIQPGSHIHYSFQFVGSERNLVEFKRWVKPKLNPSQRILDIYEERPRLGSALSRAERYLGLSSIIVVLIAGIAIAMATRRYGERHFNATALLRCLGCKQSKIIRLYALQFLVLGGSASLLGCLFGWFAQEGLFQLLRDLLPTSIASASAFSLLFGFATGMVILIGFALPPLLQLKKVSPLRLLRHDLDPLPSSGWLIYGLALSVIGLLAWYYTDDLVMTLIVIGVGLLTASIMAGIVWLLIKLSSKSFGQLDIGWRFGLQSLSRQPVKTISQILAFTVTLAAMILSFSVRNDLLDDWRAQLPESAPNHFAINIFNKDKTSFKKQLDEQQVVSSDFFPITRGRLVEINGVKVQKIVSKESTGARATQRQLSLTTSATPPDGNQIVAGKWWLSSGKNVVSIEQKLSQSLKVGIGDELTFTIGSEQIKATVSNVRSVNWDTMKPNFYFIFPPSTLDQFPQTYLTSFYLPPEKKRVLNHLVEQFPSITLLDVETLLNQFKMILSQLTAAINYLLYFALAAGFTVLFAAVYATLDDRIHNSALMRTLGAKRHLIRKVQLIEFTLLGFISGLLATVIAELILSLLYNQLFSMPHQANLALLLLTPLAGGLFVGLAGYIGIRHVMEMPPASILRNL
jgi:putative ABC transport system permease protein